MIRHIGLFVFLVLVTSLHVRADPITVWPNVLVSKDHAGLFHGEVLAAADPANPNTLIACSGVWLPESDRFPVDVAYMSRDGGQSWHQVNQAFSNISNLDPVCAIGYNNVVYLGGYAWWPIDYWWQDTREFIKPGQQDTAKDVLTYSHDGGSTWASPHVFKAGDRPMVAIDLSHSKYRGRFYYVALTNDHGKPIRGCLCLVYSDDGGKTLSHRVTLFREPPGLDTKHSLFSGGITVSPNGTVVTVAYQWPNFKHPTVVSLTSHDGGETFSKPRRITTRTVDQTLDSLMGFSVIPLIASDTSDGPFHGRLYAIWGDFQFGQGHIMLSHSENEGKTWSSPIVVDDAPPAASGKGPYAFNPAIAVNTRGVVGVSWYDQRGIPDNQGGIVRFAASTDGGESFSHSVLVAQKPSLVELNMARQPIGGAGDYQNTARIGTDPRYHIFGGDTVALVADAAGFFHAVWVDDRAGPSQVWTSKIAVGLRSALHGDPTLERLQDVSKLVSLRIEHAWYDRTTHITSADVAVVDTSPKVITAPIVLRVSRIDPARGDTTIVGADNGYPAGGAIWRFRSPQNALRLGDTTAFRTLRFYTAKPQEVALNHGGYFVPYAEFTYRAYADSAR